jgi:hypothetical protein
MKNAAADNERFCAIAAASPQKHLCKFGSLSPARTFVPPRLREAASPLGASGRQWGGEGANYQEISGEHLTQH